MSHMLDLSDVLYCFNCQSSITNLTSSSRTAPCRESLVLFDHEFDYASTLISKSHVLFEMARNCIMLIDVGPRLYLESVGTTIDNKNQFSDAEYYYNLRKQIRDFFAYLLSFVDVVTSGDENCVRLLENVVSSLTDRLHKFRFLVDRLGYIRSYTSELHGSMGSQSSHHKLHAYLDVCWYHLNLFIKLDDYREMAELFQNLQASSNQNVSFENYVSLLMSDLLLVAIANFETLALPSELLNTSPFSCTCFRKVWTMLGKLLDERYKQQKSKMNFWLFLHPLLDTVVIPLPTQTDFNTPINSIELIAPAYLACREPMTFKFWILSHLSSLAEGNFVVETNSIKLENMLTQYVMPDSLISEAELKIILPLITPLLSDVESRSEGVMILWEYFHRRLNTKSQMPGDNQVETLPSSGKSSLWLEQIKSRLNQPATSEDSWCLFLRLLGLHLQRSRLKQWQKLRGRIYSKFSPMKLQGLTELGMTNFSSLFLTLCLAVDVEEVSLKFVDLLNLLNPQDEIRRQVLWKSHLMLLRLYIHRKLDFKEIVKPLVSELNSVSHKDDAVSTRLVCMLVDEIQDILDTSSDLTLSILIDEWIPQYLARCSESNASKLYAVLLALTKKVSVLCINYPSADTASTSESLWKHVLPCVLSSSTGCCQVKAAVGYELTLLALHHQIATRSTASIFCRFINSQSLNVKIGQQYLCLLMANRTIMNTLQAKMESYQGLIVRTWLRCMILSVDDSSEDLFTLTRLISELPEIVQLTTSQGVKLSDEKDPLKAFLTVINSASSLHSARINVYVSQVESHLTRTPLTNDQIATKIFKCAAAFILHAPRLSYNRTSSATKNLLTCVMNNLLLPAAMHNPSFKLEPCKSTAISATLGTFVRGLHALGPQTDQYINKCLKDLIVQYFPLLANKPAMRNTLDSYLEDTMLHPLHSVFEDLKDAEVSEPCTFITETVASFIVCKGKTPQRQSLLAVRFLLAVLRQGNSSHSLVRLITTCALGNILDTLTFVDVTHVLHQKATELLQMVLNQPEEIRKLQVIQVVSVTKKNLAFHALYAFGLLEHLARLDVRLVEDCVPQIVMLVDAVEQMRGSGTDRCLRSGLNKLQRVINNELQGFT